MFDPSKTGMSTIPSKLLQDLFKQLLEGLEHIHKKMVVHRDCQTDPIYRAQSKEFVRCSNLLGGGFKYILFSPLPGEDFQSYFSNGLKPPTSLQFDMIFDVSYESLPYLLTCVNWQDIKLENLLLDPFSCVKIADFGVAAARGTQGFSSPSRGAMKPTGCDFGRP